MWVSEWSPKGGFRERHVADMLEANRLACMDGREPNFVPVGIHRSLEEAQEYNRQLKRQRRTAQEPEKETHHAETP